jgi:hypothetical protein
MEQIRAEFDAAARMHEWLRTADPWAASELYLERRRNNVPYGQFTNLHLFSNKMKNKGKFPKKASDIPATEGMLQEIRYELKAEIQGSEKRTSARIHRLEAQFKGLESRFKNLESKMESVLAVVEETKVMVRQICFMKEEDYSMNRSVMDGYAHVAEEVADLKERVSKLEAK